MVAGTCDVGVSVRFLPYCLRFHPWVWHGITTNENFTFTTILANCVPLSNSTTTMDHLSIHSYINLTNMPSSSPPQPPSTKKVPNMSSDLEGDSQATVEADFRSMGPIRVVSTSIR